MNTLMITIALAGLVGCGADRRDVVPLDSAAEQGARQVDSAVPREAGVAPHSAPPPHADAGARETGLPADATKTMPTPDAGSVAREAGTPIEVTIGQSPASSLAPCPPPKSPSATNIALGKGYAAGTVNFPQPGNAFDGNLATNSGGKANDDGILAVDFGVEKNLSRSVVHFANDPPPRYKIQISNDAVAWTDIIRALNPGSVDERILPAVGARYMRLLSYLNSAVGEDPGLLSPIKELEVYDREPGAPPAGCAPIIFPTPLDRKGWKASSSAGFNPQSAISNADQRYLDPRGGIANTSTWLVRAGATVGSYISLDMGAPRTFNQVNAEAEHDWLMNYKIYVSDDGINWGTSVTAGTVLPTGAYFYAPFSFQTQTKRYVKIESAFDTKGRYWGFKDINVLNTEGSSLVDLGDTTNIALNKVTAGSTVKNPGAVFDGNDATGVDDAGVVVVDLGALYSIARMNVKFAGTAGGFTYRVQSSIDGTTWVSQQAVGMTNVFSRPFAGVVMANYSCRYLRITFPPTHVNNRYVPQRVNEIEVFRSVGPGAVGRNSK